VISVRPIQRAFTFDDVALFFFYFFYFFFCLVCVSDKRMPRCRVLRSLSDRHKKGKKLKGLDGSYWPMSAFFSCFCFFGGGDNQLFFLLNLKFCLIHICQLRKCL
jgi:hypothetical protein